MRFLPEGRPPTKEDLQKAAQFNPVVKAVLDLIGRGLTFEEGLIGAILALVDQNEALIQELFNRAFRNGVIYIKETTIGEAWPKE